MLIGLYSPVPQSGKSTVARFLQEAMPTTVMPMAGPLKTFAAALLQEVGADAKRHLYLDKEAPIEQLPGKPTGRRLLQTLGTEWGRDCIASRLWVGVWEKAYSRHRFAWPNDLVIVDDVRFPDEAEAVQAAGGELWMVMRPKQTIGRGHRSEGALDQWRFDQVLLNDEGLEELKAETFSLLDGLPSAGSDSSSRSA